MTEGKSIEMSPEGARYIKEMAKTRGYTLKTLSKELGISNQILYNLHRGGRRIPYMAFQTMCDILDINPEKFSGAEEELNFEVTEQDMLKKGWSSLYSVYSERLRKRFINVPKETRLEMIGELEAILEKYKLGGTEDGM